MSKTEYEQRKWVCKKVTHDQFEFLFPVRTKKIFEMYSLNIITVAFKDL